MITNSTSNNAFSYWWVGTVQPARSVRTTTSFWYTGCWHFVASFASEAIPGWQRMQVSLVTSQVLLICICHTTVKTVKNVIVAAGIWCYRGNRITLTQSDKESNKTGVTSQPVICRYKDTPEDTAHTKIILNHACVSEWEENLGILWKTSQSIEENFLKTQPTQWIDARIWTRPHWWRPIVLFPFPNIAANGVSDRETFRRHLIFPKINQISTSSI